MLVGYLVAPWPTVQYGFYTVGLVIGFSTVGPWLYFCSAYTGRTLHNNRTVRITAIGVFLVVVLVKLTNPLHYQYFVVESGAAGQLLVHHQPFHWIAMGLAYALAFVGFFMLFELFARVDYSPTPLIAILGLTGLPVLFDLIGAATPYLQTLNYSPIGVAAFAVGFFYLYLDQFQRVRVAGESDQPVIILDADGRIRESNRAARRVFPALAGMRTQPISTVVPELPVEWRSEECTLSVRVQGNERHYSVIPTPFTAGHTQLGTLITLRDVTEREQYRQELERQNDRLERFTAMVSHDLRNPLNVATLRVEEARAESDGQSEPLAAAETALERMESLIDDLLSLARQGQPIDDTDQVKLSACTNRCWEMIDAPTASLTLESDLEFEADPERLQQLFENLFRNAIEHGGSEATIHVGALEDGRSGFYVADDGPGIPAEHWADIFESGYSTTENGTGLGLAIVKEIVQAHDWTIQVGESWGSGTRFEISGVETTK